MTGVQFADGFDGPDRIALGLSAPQLATVVGGGLCGYAVFHSPLPGLVRMPAAVALTLIAAVLGWGRIAERPLLDWCWLGLRFAARPRSGGALLASDGSEDGEPPWARWLRQGGARPGGEPAPPPTGQTPPQAPEGADGWTVEDSLPAVAEPAAAAAGEDAVDPTSDGPAAVPQPTGGRAPLAGPADPHGARLARVLRERLRRRRDPRAAAAPVSTGDAARPAEEAAPRPGFTPILEIDRPSIVLLPEPLEPEDPDDGDHDDEDGPAGRSASPAGADVDAADDDADGDAELRGSALLRLPHIGDDLPAGAATDVRAVATPPLRADDAPVFVGATRRITFFSLNGGSGRTTLATEVACLLAARGAHRESADAPPRPLSVALLDLDLRSANVSMRLGVPQPTILDYLLDGGEDPATLRRHLVSHPSGLRVLLGPPKPLGQAGPGLEPARVAEIVHQLERDGAHFIVIDVGADLGAVTTWVLTAVHDIYVVIRPTAGGIQDAYRSTEALRRLGLGHKLRYVVNRARGPLDVEEVMADLGGRIIATIPDDPRIEDAENRHRQVALDGHGPAAAAIARLAADVYPGLRAPGRRGRLGRLRRRRVG